jgi:hypothetical protein
MLASYEGLLLLFCLFTKNSHLINLSNFMLVNQQLFSSAIFYCRLFMLFRRFLDSLKSNITNYSLIFANVYEKKAKQIFTQAHLLQHLYDTGFGMADYKCSFRICKL